MEAWMDRILERFGQQAILYTRNGYFNLQLVFQSVNSRFWQNMEHVHTPLGRVPRGQYLCMLPAGTKAQVGDSLALQGKEYDIRKLEDMYIGDKVIYIWGLCVEKGV